MYFGCGTRLDKPFGSGPRFRQKRDDILAGRLSTDEERHDGGGRDLYGVPISEILPKSHDRADLKGTHSNVP